MCGGVCYREGQQTMRCYFPNPYAQLPVVTRGNGVVMVRWGRRRGEQGQLPLGGWARLESIRTGAWNRWQPRPVRLQLQSFMEKDIEDKSHWFELTPGQWIQGLIARQGSEQRVYVVTITPESTEAIHPRWPRIVSN